MSALTWEMPPPEMEGSATVALANASATTQYRVNDFEYFSVVCLVKAGKGTINHLIAENLASQPEAKALAQADWDSGERT